METSTGHDLASFSLKRAGLILALGLPGPSMGRSAIHPSISHSRHTGSGNVPSFIRSSIHCWDMLIFSATCISRMPAFKKGIRLIRMMLADQSDMRLRGYAAFFVPPPSPIGLSLRNGVGLSLKSASCRLSIHAMISESFQSLRCLPAR